MKEKLEKMPIMENWIEDCILWSTGDSAIFKIMDAKLHVPIVTLSTKGNVNLTKQLSDGFKRSVYWNIYQNIRAKVMEKGKNIYELLSASFQGVKRLFILAYTIAADAASNEAGIKTIESVFFQEERLIAIMYWSMEEIFMINQLMI